MLTDEMKDAIEKNLPAQIGSVLQDRLAELDGLQGQVDSMTEELKMAKKNILEWEKVETDLDERDRKLRTAESLNVTDRQSLDACRRELGDEAHRVALADLTAEMRGEQVAQMRTIISEVFRSPMYRKTVTVSGSHDVITPDPNGGGYPQTHTAHHNDTTTTEVDES